MMIGIWIEAKEDDSVESVAFRYGMLPEQIWQHSANSSLREARASMHVLQKGDRLFVPDIAAKSLACGTERFHSFRRHAVPSMLPLKLQLGVTVLAHHSCRFEFADRAPVEMMTDHVGFVQVPVMPDVGAGRLVVDLENGQKIVIELAPRCLDPIDTPCGIQARLRNLGYLTEAMDGEYDLPTVLALANFQADHQLQISGTAEKSTLASLMQAHGS